jgi:hypothetical protein
MARFGRNAKKAFGDEAGNVFGPASTDIQSAINSLGGGDKGKRALAEQLSGTDDRNSRTYKTARDYISRHLRGARGKVQSTKYAGVLTAANQEGKKNAIIAGGSLNVRINADIKISEKTWKNGRLNATGSHALRGQDLADYLREVEAGRYSNAVDIVAKSYGINNSVTLTNFRGIDYP